MNCAVVTSQSDEEGGVARRRRGGRVQEPVEVWTGDTNGMISKWKIDPTCAGENESIISQIGTLIAPGPVANMMVLKLNENGRVMVRCVGGEAMVFSLQVPNPSTRVMMSQPHQQQTQQEGCVLYVEKCDQVWSSVENEIIVWGDLEKKSAGKQGSGFCWAMVTSLREHTDKIMSLCLVRNTLVCSASADQSLILWDVVRCVPQQRLVGHTGGVGWVTPAGGDGWGVWSGAEGGGVWLWSGNDPREKKSDTEELCTFKLKKMVEGEEEEGGEEGEEETGGFVAVEMGDGVGVEDRMKIIDVNIGGLKDMVPGAKEMAEVEAALKLCELVVKDLKKTIALVGGEGPVMADIEDRITVTVTQKKQLMARKRAMKKTE